MQWVLVSGVPVMNPDGVDRDQKPGRAIHRTPPDSAAARVTI